MDITPEWFDTWFDAKFPEEEYGPKDIRRIMGIGKSRVYRAIDSGELEAIRVGTWWLVPRPALKAWLLAGYNLNN
ncbi:MULTISPECIES: excisionase family DNA-binding protein [Desulfococcus]|jgi:excisionase family DNA binding protein|uniref:DNA binding domain protein, excisionase family n=1 Tax=Desulfococcus multivorans DSM 2059 TaxID=1121405 RepID=S7U255_DESML|nr:helix-turn-helix domain-containing protein [Desulfococcus multivorans]AOY57202.1 putative DNA-binding domain protein, excisionase family [Desulfococcus multivorans]AQU99672.1 DNA-binding protein [Desulfococcus multivorans]EPR43407.1 DNA binding domain protein, excisionase family [Desulfococcus multivorans DSM 2059]MDX9819638.1 helix-turn-helix domain-containing protein [Desulfococcus multivorans]SKA25663.1 DNA binding domain-containing protein, excisionase family [Desulfococcus multivorans 